MGWHECAHAGWMWVGWIAAAAVIGALVWVAVRGARRDTPPPPESPEAILKRRYAAGEIDRDTYEQRLADIRQDGTGGDP